MGFMIPRRRGGGGSRKGHRHRQQMRRNSRRRRSRGRRGTCSFESEGVKAALALWRLKEREEE